MRPFQIVRIVLVLVAVCLGIWRGYSRSSSSTTRVMPSGETAYGRAADDPEILAAAKTARDQWPDFVAQFKQRQPRDGFSIKIPLATKSGSNEHIWMTVSAIDGDSVRGNLANEPFEDIGYKNGDPLSVPASTVEDWLIVKNGKKFRGGFSLEILQNTK